MASTPDTWLSAFPTVNQTRDNAVARMKRPSNRMPDLLQAINNAAAKGLLRTETTFTLTADEHQFLSLKGYGFDRVFDREMRTILMDTSEHTSLYTRAPVYICWHNH